MPIKLEYRKSGVIIWCYGVLTGEEILDANRTIYRHPRVASFVYQLAINSRVTELRATAADMRDLAAMDLELAAHEPQVVIGVAESDYVFGMFRMWNLQAESDSFKTLVVRSLAEARRILSEHGVVLDSLDYPADTY